MLTLRSIGSSKQEVLYYAQLGKSEQHDYYAKGGDRPGNWWGAGAAKLGLVGEVTPEAFTNLLRGYSPDGTTKLVQNAGEEGRRAAFDLSWSLPKSVPVAWAQAGPALRTRIEACLEQALKKVLDKFAKECGVTRRGKLGRTVEEAGLVGAIFRHDTSRPVAGALPDPNVHFHVVVANCAVREDGSTGAFDARPLFRTNMMMALGALYRAEVSKALGELGLSSHRPRKPGREELASWFELDAVPESLLVAMSKRRTEIKRLLAERGVSGAIEAEKAALETRSTKTVHTRKELDAAWQQAGVEHGLTKDNLEQVTLAPRVRQQGTAAEAFARALHRLTSDRAHFSEQDILRFAAEEAQATGVGADEIVAAVTNGLSNSQQIVKLRDVKGEPRYTTRSMLELERRMLAAARQLHSRSGHAVSFGVIAETEKRYATLRGEQRAALRHITAYSDIACVNGIAGSGKTYLLEAARVAWEHAGFHILGTSLAAKAARGLETGSGITSLHIHKLLHEIRQERITLTDKHVLVVDEAGMVGTLLMEQLIRTVEAGGAKLVLVGDHRQLQAISAGAPFRVLSEQVGVAKLTEIIRQRESWARDVVHQFRSGEAADALQELSLRGLLHVGEDRERTMAELVRDWCEGIQATADAKERLVFAATNFEVEILNAMCQAQCQLRGLLGTGFVEVGGERLHVGDRVAVTKNNRSLLLQNGMLGTVTEVAGTILKVKFDDGYQVAMDVEHFDKLRLAYAMSTHKAQGVTIEQAFVLAGGSMTDRELTYVQASRARGTTRVYCDRTSAGPELERLAAEMSRSRPKDLALEHTLEEAA